MSKPTTAQSGFTLLELLIAVTIMVITIGGAIAGFLTFQARQEVLTTAKNVQQLVRTAQGKARVRETPTAASLTAAGFPATTCNSLNNRLQGYRIKLSSTQAELFALCGPDANYLSNLVEINPAVLTQTFSGVTYSGPSHIDFYTLYRGLSIQGGGTPRRLEFIGSDAGNSFFFTIESGGAISEVSKI